MRKSFKFAYIFPRIWDLQSFNRPKFPFGVIVLQPEETFFLKYFILFFNFTILYCFCHISTWIYNYVKFKNKIKLKKKTNHESATMYQVAQHSSAGDGFSLSLTIFFNTHFKGYFPWKYKFLLYPSVSLPLLWRC